MNDITDGEIVIDGKSITKANKKELREIRTHIGLISQQFNLVKRSTVQKNILSGKLGTYSTFKSVFGLFSKEDYEKVNEVLEKVGLSDKLQSRCDELSGGQQQRVAIVRTLAMKPEVILLDEITASLDPEMVRGIEDIVKKLSENDHMTMILVTHQMNFAKRVADQVLFLEKGRIIEKTPCEQFFTEPQSERAQQFLTDMDF